MKNEIELVKQYALSKGVEWNQSTNDKTGYIYIDITTDSFDKEFSIKVTDNKIECLATEIDVNWDDEEWVVIFDEEFTNAEEVNSKFINRYFK